MHRFLSGVLDKGSSVFDAVGQRSQAGEWLDQRGNAFLPGGSLEFSQLCGIGGGREERQHSRVPGGSTAYGSPQWCRCFLLLHQGFYALAPQSQQLL